MMIQQIRHTIVSVRDLVATAGPFILLVIALLGLAYWYVEPQPPRTLVMATGPDNSDYDQFGAKYKALLAKHNIRLELRQSAGSRENLESLLKPDGDVGVSIVREGTVSREELVDRPLTAIGSLFYEPVWLFYRDSVQLNSLADLRGKAVNLGPPGSGTSRLIDSMLAQNQLSLADLNVQRMDHTDAVIALLEGKLDGLFFTSSSGGLLIQMLLKTPGVRLFNFVHAEAYSRRLPSLTHVVLPRGVVDLAADMPKEDVHLLAPTSTLVARDGTHPALIQLLVQAAAQIHGGADWFGKLHEFPSAAVDDFPLADEAKRFYKTGTPFLQRYLPFWLANMVDRMWVVVVSLAALLIPLSRIVPPLYVWRIRSRIYRWYAQLREVEIAAQLPGVTLNAEQSAELLSRLDVIEAKVNDIAVPLSRADEVYSLRQHIEMVRAKLSGTTLPKSPI
jgi:uncharacterized protein